MKNIFTVAALSTGLLISASAMAGVEFTATESESYSMGTNNVADMNFNGFDSSLGTLNSVHFTWTVDATLEAQITNIGSDPATVGDPVLVSAASLITIAGAGIASDLTGQFELETDSVTATVPGNFVTTTVASAADSASGLTCLNNDDSCNPDVANSDLSGYIGGVNLFTISASSVSVIQGSISNPTFGGTDGVVSGVLTIQYDYTVDATPTPTPTPTPPPVGVSEPATLSLMGLMLAGLGFVRRKQA